MFSKKSLTITLAFVLLLGLAAMGIVYGQWTQSLNINGTVNTGELKVTPSLSGDTCGAIVVDENTISVTTNDVFPGYECSTTIHLKNVGTIPVYFVVTPNILDPNGVTYQAGNTAPLNALTLECPADKTLTVGQEKTCTLDLYFPDTLNETTLPETGSFQYHFNLNFNQVIS